MKVQLNVFLVSTAMCLVLLFGADISSAQNNTAGVNTIVIDPGHGGRDPGTVWGDHKEKDINLAVGLMLGDLIKKNLPDVKVIYTRDTDVFIPLNQRGEIANKAGADLFLSIHVNAVDRGRPCPSGALTLVMGVDKAGANLDIAMRENDVIKYEEDYTTTYEGYDPNSTESFIIFSLMQYIHLDQSLAFADIIQKHYKSSTPMPDMGVRQQALLVLWKTTMPSVLTEIGFLPNEHDRNVLITKAGQQKMATALFNALSEYKSKVEGKSAPLQIEIPAGGGGSDSDAAVVYTVSETDTQTDVYYTIQIMSASRKIAKNSSEFKSYRGKITERRDGSRYKYSVGKCRSYEEAVKLQEEIRAEFPDAFMIAFDGERQIPVNAARRSTER